MSRDRDVICKIISKMLDNPDSHGIYPTSVAYGELEQYIRSVRINPKVIMPKELSGRIVEACDMPSGCAANCQHFQNLFTYGKSKDGMPIIRKKLCKTIKECCFKSLKPVEWLTEV